MYGSVESSMFWGIPYCGLLLKDDVKGFLNVWPLN